MGRSSAEILCKDYSMGMYQKAPLLGGGGGGNKITVICLRNCDCCQFTDVILSLCVLEIPVSNAQLLNMCSIIANGFLYKDIVHCITETEITKAYMYFAFFTCIPYYKL